MAAAIFCDQNFLIAAHDAGPRYELEIVLAVSRGATLVVGLWTLVEIARARDENTMVEIAAFLDRLRPQWLPERRSLQREEASAAFFAFLRLPYVRFSVLRPLAHVAAELVNRPVPIGRQYSAVEFAGVLRSNIKPIQAAYEQNRQARAVTARAWKRGWFKDKHRVVLEAYVGPLLPDFTPAGVLLDPGSKRAFLQQVVLAEMPSIAVEHALFEDSLRYQQKFRSQTFLDRQHVIPALPYVDVILSDDAGLGRAIKRVVPTLPFPTAKVMRKQEFDRTYMR